MVQNLFNFKKQMDPGKNHLFDVIEEEAGEFTLEDLKNDESPEKLDKNIP